MSYWQDFAIAAIGLSTLVRLYLRHNGTIVHNTFVAGELPITLDLNSDRYAYYAPGASRVFTLKQLSSLDPRALAAAWYAGELRYDELPEVAAQLLTRGLDTPALRRVAGEQPASSADISILAEQMFFELEAGGPRSRNEALDTICLVLAAEVRSGERKPADAVLTISSLYDLQPKQPVTDIILLNYAYEHLLDDNPVASFAELDAQARTAFAELERKLTPSV